MSEIIEEVLKTTLKNSGSQYAQNIYDAMSYSVFGAGKRVRPLLTELFYKACGGNDDGYVFPAAAVEMIHTYSLIHDDLPCMDNDDMRRGRPSNHKVYGEDIALLAGDGLLTRAFELLLSQSCVEALGTEKALSCAAYLAKRSGADGMIGGQCIDLASEGHEISLEELDDMVIGKTVCLIMAASVMGVIAAGGNSEKIEAAENFSMGIGLAFQIRDDILDVIGDADIMGKNVGVDNANNRKNYVTLYGLEKAQELVESFTNSAITALEIFDKSKTQELKSFALNLATRNK